MAQQNKNSNQPEGFGGFDDLISEFSEDLVMPPQAKPAKPIPASPPPSQAKPVTPAPPPAPPRTDPPKPSSPPPQAPAKPEVRVVVEHKPIPSSLPKAGEQGSQKAVGFYIACGVVFFIWLFSGTNQNQTSTRTSPSMTAESTARSGSTYTTVAPSVSASFMIEPNETKPKSIKKTGSKNTTSILSKPSTSKAESDPLVKEIQKKLLSLGYSPGTADGYIGQKTLNAIKQFQKENRLPIGSKVNEELLSSLDRAQPHIVSKRRQESPQSRSVKNKKENSVCPTGEICVRDFRESFSSSSDDKEISTHEQQSVYYGNSNTSPPQKPVSSPYKNSNTRIKNGNTRIVCPTSIFCYPQPY